MPKRLPCTMSPPPASPLQWLSLVAAVWLQSINGPNTDFPIYSSQLKSLLSTTQLRLIFLISASDVGKLFGFLSGIATLHLPLPIVLLVGASLIFFGYFLQYLLLVTGSLSSPSSYWKFLLLSVVSGNGICWINTVSYIISVRNFPACRRVAVGLSTSYVGVSAVVYTALADAISNTPPERKARTYLLLNAVVPLAVAFVTAPFASEVVRGSRGGTDGSATRDRRLLLALFSIAVATGVFATVGSIGRMLASHVLLIGLAAMLAGAPLVAPLWSWWCKEGERKNKVYNEEGVGSGVVVGSGGDGDEVVVVVVEEDEEEEEEESVWMTLRSVEFWLYFFGYLLGPTVGLVFLNNLGQVAESRGVERTSSVVSLSSSFGLLGRLLPPLLDYFCEGNHLISRPAFMAVLATTLALCFFLLINTTSIALYFSTATISACTGAITIVAVSTTEELFGGKHFGVNHNLIIASIPIGSILFSYFAAVVYRRSEDANGLCIGSACYRMTLTIWGIFCTIGTFLYVILYMRTRKEGSQMINGVQLTKKEVVSNNNTARKGNVTRCDATMYNLFVCIDK